MTSPSKHGCRVKTPERRPGEPFHDYMRRLYSAQPPAHAPGNSQHVQAKLPLDLYLAFNNLLKEKNWSKSEGVQYAIYQLLNSKNV